MSIIETVTLFFKNAESDKFYVASIEEKDGKYSVPFTYGRRGTSGASGIKIEGVDLEKAKKIRDKLVSGKMSKGYQLDTKGVTPYSGVVSDKKSTGLFPQLPNPIEESEVEHYFNDPSYGAQEKFDGKNITLKHESGKTIASNKKGFECGYPSEYESAMKEMAYLNNFTKIILGGEAIGTRYFVHDFLEIDGEDLRKLSYSDRYDRLALLSFPKAFKLSYLARTTAEKKALCDKLKKARKEGMVFKKLNAKHTAGKAHSDSFKFKFYATLSAIVVEGREGKRSIALELIDDKGKRVKVGNCTISPNFQVPKVSTEKEPSIVEVRYLYCLEGGSLYQPTYLGPRDDIDVEECLMSQVKIKGTEED